MCKKICDAHKFNTSRPHHAGARGKVLNCLFSKDFIIVLEVFDIIHNADETIWKKRRKDTKSC